MESFATVILLLNFSFAILLIYVLARSWSGMDIPRELKLKAFSLGVVTGLFTCIYGSAAGTQAWIVGLLFLAVAFRFLWWANPDFPTNVIDPNWEARKVENNQENLS